MDICWWGHSCFCVREAGVTVVMDPHDSSVDFRLPRTKADIVTVSHHHPHHDDLASIFGEYKLIDGPGEYEIRSVFVTGLATYPRRRSTEDTMPPNRNVVFALDFDGLVVCHLGDLANVPDQEQVEALGDVDVLLVPVGGGGDSLNASQAAEVVRRIEPRLVVPMHCPPMAVEGKGGSIDRFLKEMGGREVLPAELVRISASNLPEETQAVVLNVSTA